MTIMLNLCQRNYINWFRYILRAYPKIILGEKKLTKDIVDKEQNMSGS